MRCLGIDYGTRRIGIAVSDELNLIAQPLEFIPAESLPGVLERLRAIITEKQVGRIIIGMPRNMDGTYGPAAEKVREFVAACSRTISIPIQTMDERLTTVQANRTLIEGKVRRAARKEKVDMLAAAILLQSYLDAQPRDRDHDQV